MRPEGVVQAGPVLAPAPHVPLHGAAPSSRLAALVRSRARGAGDSVDDAGGLLLPVAPYVVVRVVLHQGLDALAMEQEP